MRACPCMCVCVCECVMSVHYGCACVRLIVCTHVLPTTGRIRLIRYDKVFPVSPA
jgi:hypothetical protein